MLIRLTPFWRERYLYRFYSFYNEHRKWFQNLKFWKELKFELDWNRIEIVLEMNSNWNWIEMNSNWNWIEMNSNWNWINMKFKLNWKRTEIELKINLNWNQFEMNLQGKIQFWFEFEIKVEIVFETNLKWFIKFV